MIDILIKECLPILREFGIGKYAITIGGSRGKGISDSRSDVDFRIYADQLVTGDAWDQAIEKLYAIMDVWRSKGIEIDGVWPRTILEIDESLSGWLSGNLNPIPKEWTVWGYHMPTDIYNQLIVEDPYKIAQGWKERMSNYPEELRQSIFRKHMGRLKYWRNDYHYKSKVVRGDVVFLASLSSSLVHDLMQVLFALNSVYFPGDGINLQYTSAFTIKPENLNDRIKLALYPDSIENRFEEQLNTLIDLIVEVDGLVSPLLK